MYFPDRDVAQSGRAPRSGRGGRWFKSSRPDQPTYKASAGRPIIDKPKYLLLKIKSLTIYPVSVHPQTVLRY